MRRPIPRFVAVSAACLAIAAVWTLWPGQQSTAVAFNKFVDSLVTAKSARLDMEVDITGQPHVKATAYYLAPAKMRQEIQDTINISDMEAGKMVILNTKSKMAIVINMVGRPKKMKESSMDLFARMRELLEESQARQQKNQDGFEAIGEKEIDGQRAVGFRCFSTFGETTLWGDPKTGLPVRIETVFTGVPKTEVTMSDFDLNVRLDDSLFDTTPPEGYKVQSFDVDTSPPKEQDILKAFRLAAEWSDGVFPKTLGTATIQQLIVKQAVKEGPAKVEERMGNVMEAATELGRGATFIEKLPESADAHYAGAGVKLDEPDRPIFWYKPDGKQTYRVVYADLSVQDAAEAPQVEGAVRLHTSLKGTPAEAKPE